MSDHQYIESMSGPPRLVDGPGYTLLQVSPPIAGRSLEELEELEDADEGTNAGCTAGHLWDEECPECS